MTRNSKFRRLLTRSQTGLFVTGFVHGLAQMGSFASAGPITSYPKSNSAEAMKNDWQRVGGDMKRGMTKVRGEKAKG
ncbi:hypothetical protein SAMN05216374_0949 [Tardiphaga sp. OK246]|uniref:hypothetical protein n=1 Tax=Tardiphaga sp. OK246 TaxID=1855307 RepID=UPI000B6E00FD|nr:hypothetical protein [Tardiphaga sp. OK246]SNS35462.1 hypothetical protein SAMN05216374_0949 [Tardiphaga sp. OK246]